MKKQLAMNAMAFNKNSLVELNTQQLKDTDSGITPTITTSSGWCIAGGFAIGVAIGLWGE